jgi:hypothetical protein
VKFIIKEPTALFSLFISINKCGRKLFSTFYPMLLKYTLDGSITLRLFTDNENVTP